MAVVSEAISDDALRSALGDDLPDDAEVLVVAPALVSKTRMLLADPDKGIERAEEVQKETVERLDDAGIDAVGETGESDPLLAVQDALQTFPADRIVMFVRPGGDKNWLEEGVVDQVRERFPDRQVRHVEVG